MPERLGFEDIKKNHFTVQSKLCLKISDQKNVTRGGRFEIVSCKALFTNSELKIAPSLE